MIDGEVKENYGVGTAEECRRGLLGSGVGRDWGEMMVH